MAELMRLEHLAGTDAADDGTENKPLVDEDSDDDEKMSRSSSKRHYENLSGVSSKEREANGFGRGSSHSSSQTGKDFKPVLSKTKDADSRLTVIVPNVDLEPGNPTEEKAEEMTVL